MLISGESGRSPIVALRTVAAAEVVPPSLRGDNAPPPVPPPVGDRCERGEETISRGDGANFLIIIVLVFGWVVGTVVVVVFPNLPR